MEWGVPIFNNSNDYNYTRHVGWSESNNCIKKFYNDETILIMSRKITELLQGVDTQGRPIIVPDQTIKNVMDTIYESYRPPTGDIYGRYNVPSGEPENYVQSLIDQTIEIIVADVKANLGMEQANAKLSAWIQIYGSFNNHGLRSHPPIKIRERNSNHRGFVSFMNY